MRIAVFTKNNTNPAYAAARLGAERAAARCGAQVVHYVPNEPDNVDEQSALLEQALQGRLDAIALSPVHPTRLAPLMDRARVAGIPIVAFISRPAAGHWDAFVGCDDFQIGRDVADCLFRALEGCGDIVIVEGSSVSSTSIERVRGFHAAAQRHPGIRVVASCQGQYQFEPARREFARALARIERLDGVVAANDLMALAVIAVLRDASRAARVVGVNAIPEAVAAIKSGALLATADFSALNLGALATESAIRRARGEAVPREILLPVEIVDRNNVNTWDRPYEERPCVEWKAALAHAT